VFPNQVQPDCGGTGSGIGSAVGIFGTPPYTAVWTNAAMTVVETDLGLLQGQASNASGLFAGTYTVTFTDATGTCITPAMVTITTGAAPDVSSTSSTPESCATNDGTATVSPTGASGVYTYQWDNSTGNQTTPTATGLAAGTYTVVVTDGTSLCTSTTAVIVADGCSGSIPTTNLRALDCGIALTSINQIIFVNPVPSADNYEWRFTNLTDGSVYTKERTNPQTNFILSWLTGIEFGTTYDVDVRVGVNGTWGAYGNICQVTTPAAPPVATSLQPSDCGLVIVDFSEVVYATPVQLASDYEWEFAPTDGTATITYQRGFASNSLPIGALGLTFNKTYDVRVRVRIGNDWQPFAGSTCQVFGPTQITTNVTPAFCNTTPADYNDQFTCVPVVGATNYQWRFVSQVDGTVIKRYRNNGNNNMWFNKVGSTVILVGVTYDVAVRVEVAGVWSVWGSICPMTAPASMITSTGTSSMALDNSIETETLDKDVFVPANDINVYPNPSNGAEVRVDFVNPTPDYNTATVQVFDLSGKVMHEETYSWYGTLSRAVQFNEQLPGGIYLMRVTHNGEAYTKKLFVK